MLAKAFLKQKADPNAQDGVGQTPLHIAVPNGLVEVVHLLLEARARPDISCHTNESPLNVLDRVEPSPTSKRNVQKHLRHAISHLNSIAADFSSMRAALVQHASQVDSTTKAIRDLE
jgi:ankyrin repeat protein